MIDGRALVLEAVEPVRLTPLRRWMAAAKGDRTLVKRLRPRAGINSPFEGGEAPAWRGERRADTPGIQPTNNEGRWDGSPHSNGEVISVRGLRDAETVFSEAATARFIQQGRALLGRHYDGKFEWDDRRLYCSELVYKLYERALQIELVEPERIEALKLSNPRVKRLVAQRLGPGRAPNPKEPIVTPASLTRSDKLITVAEHPRQ